MASKMTQFMSRAKTTPSPSQPKNSISFLNVFPTGDVGALTTREAL